jgi:recombinational DNA repair protein RecT
MTQPHEPGRAQDGRAKFLALIRMVAQEFANAAPLSVPKEGVARAIDRVMLAFRAQAAQKPEIYECTPQSIGRALSLSALTGLMPGGPMPEVDLIPRKTRVKEGSRWVDGPKELQWQIGWRGYKTLAARAGCLAKPVLVFEGEHFEWSEGMESTLRHRPSPGSRMVLDADSLAPLVCGYVVVSYADGRKDFVVLDRDGIAKRRDRSDGWRQWKEGKIKSTPWSEWPDEQALKTCMRYAAQRGVLLMDDVARYALDADGAEDRPIVVDVPAVTAAPMLAAPATERPALTDRGGLDDLEADLLTPEEREREAVRAEQPGPKRVEPKLPPKGDGWGPADGGGLVGNIESAEADLAELAGAEVVAELRRRAGVKDGTAAEVAQRLGDEGARLHLTRLRNALDDARGSS